MDFSNVPEEVGEVNAKRLDKPCFLQISFDP